MKRRTVLAGAAGLGAVAIAGRVAAQERAPPSGAEGVPTTSAAQEARQPVDRARPQTGRVALITGAARGISRATAVELGRLGANVALVDIADPDGVPVVNEYRLASRAELTEAERLTAAAGVRSVAIIADVRDKAAMTRAVSRTVDELGGLDIVVANAGVIRTAQGIEGYDQAAFSAMMDVNVLGTVNTV